MTPDEPKPQITVSREFLEWFHDTDPCRFDHHGGCQAHGFLEPEPGEVCPQRQLADLLAAAAPPTPSAHGELLAEARRRLASSTGLGCTFGAVVSCDEIVRLLSRFDPAVPPEDETAKESK